MSEKPEWLTVNANGQATIHPALVVDQLEEILTGKLFYYQSSWWFWKERIWEIIEEHRVKTGIRDLLVSHPISKFQTRLSVIKDILEQLRLVLIPEGDFLGFDQNHDLIVFKNGTLDLKKDEFAKIHRPEDFKSIMLEFDFDESKNCTRWLKFLDEIDLDQDTQTRIQEWVGYLLIPTAKLQKCLYLIGEGANGKSVFLNTIRSMLGYKNVSSLEMAELFDRFKIEKLRGKLVNIATDCETSKSMDSRFKKIVSGEPIVSEKKFQDSFEFIPYARLLFSANDFVHTRDKSHGFFRRFDTVRFPRVFKPSEQDFDLEKTLLEELPGIFNWALKGLRRLESNDWIMTPSSSMEEAHSEFKRGLNPLHDFVDEKCSFGPDNSVKAEDFRQYYFQWSRDNRHRALPATTLGKELLRLKPQIEKHRIMTDKKRQIYYKGIALVSEK